MVFVQDEECTTTRFKEIGTHKDYEVDYMLNGIIIMGLNGCGKSTVCRELAQRLGYKRIDVEDYYFLDSQIPYTVSRTYEEVQQIPICRIANRSTHSGCCGRIFRYLPISS